MEDKRLVATKKDIIIFFVFAFSFTIFSYMYMYIEVLAILINSFIKFMNIKNEIFLKITKILFNIFSFLYIALMGLIASGVNSFNKDSYERMKFYKESLELTLSIIQNFIC